MVVTCDSGSTSSLISHGFATKAQIPISKTTHIANQADGKTQLQACGETCITLSRGTFKFQLEALVVKQLDCEILAGMPFMKDNNIILDIPKDQIIIDDKHCITYTKHNLLDKPKIRRTDSYLLRAAEKRVIFPGEFAQFNVPPSINHATEICIEPRCDSKSPSWPNPDVINIVDGTIRLPNISEEPIVLVVIFVSLGLL